MIISLNSAVSRNMLNKIAINPGPWYSLSAADTPIFCSAMKQELSVLYKNTGKISNPMKDNSHLLKHDENSDVIHFPSSRNATG